ncbi:hypothetical protein [Xanthomonas medicagonis]|uniref:hypothetical protein n=1 Tax=Xanthomonas medicagonis TaxID=3160841 RepID=UPI0035133C78
MNCDIGSPLDLDKRGSVGDRRDMAVTVSAVTRHWRRSVVRRRSGRARIAVPPAPAAYPPSASLARATNAGTGNDVEE